MGRKYSVVVCDNNYGEMRFLQETLQIYGAALEDTRKLAKASWKNEPDAERTEKQRKWELSDIAGDVEIGIIHSKKDCAEYVGSHAKTIDLVITNRSSVHSPDDMDGPTAVRYMREHGYEGRIVVRSTFLLPEHTAELKAAGADKVMQKEMGSQEIFEIIADCYRAARGTR